MIVVMGYLHDPRSLPYVLAVLCLAVPALRLAQDNQGSLNIKKKRLGGKKDRPAREVVIRGLEFLTNM